MLLLDFNKIGNKIFAIRKAKGLTQAEAAELAGLSDRTYADIERGNVNMRIETILKICKGFHITPNEFLTEKAIPAISEKDIAERLNKCTAKEKETALKLLDAYLSTLE
ncbi:MAG: helix-turn-helix transcriptional regulator [Oscillospiraceae bacterium]|nr:helix-turn-helix transcriptional regulator [Oscillospiraceae bacterium]